MTKTSHICNKWFHLCHRCVHAHVLLQSSVLAKHIWLCIHLPIGVFLISLPCFIQFSSALFHIAILPDFLSTSYCYWFSESMAPIFSRWWPEKHNFSRCWKAVCWSIIQYTLFGNFSILNILVKSICKTFTRTFWSEGGRFKLERKPVNFTFLPGQPYIL